MEPRDCPGGTLSTKPGRSSLTDPFSRQNPLGERRSANSGPTETATAAFTAHAATAWLWQLG